MYKRKYCIRVWQKYFSYHRKIYYGVLDSITNAVTDHFDQQDFKFYINLENTIIIAVKGDDLYADYGDILSIYQKDFDDNQFQVQLEPLSEYCKEYDIVTARKAAEVLIPPQSETTSENLSS